MGPGKELRRASRCERGSSTRGVGVRGTKGSEKPELRALLLPAGESLTGPAGSEGGEAWGPGLAGVAEGCWGSGLASGPGPGPAAASLRPSGARVGRAPSGAPLGGQKCPFH